MHGNRIARLTAAAVSIGVLVAGLGGCTAPTASGSASGSASASPDYRDMRTLEAALTPAAWAAIRDPVSANYDPSASVTGVTCSGGSAMTGGSELVSCAAELSDGTSFTTPVIVAADGRSFRDEAGTTGTTNTTTTTGSSPAAPPAPVPAGITCPPGQTAVFGACVVTQAVDPAVAILLPAGTSPAQCSSVQLHLTSFGGGPEPYTAAAVCDHIASADYEVIVTGVNSNYASSLQQTNHLPTVGGCDRGAIVDCADAWSGKVFDGTTYMDVDSVPFQTGNGHAVSEGCPAGAAPTVLLYSVSTLLTVIAVNCSGNANQLFENMWDGILIAGSS